MAEQNRSSHGFLPFLLGVAVMAIAGSIFYLFMQRQATAPTTSPISNAPTTVAPASPQSPAQSPTAPTNTLPPAPSVDLQVNHPNGSTARLTQLTFEADHLTAAIAITNGHKEAIRLNAAEDFVMTDNFGNQYNLAVPPENAEISIAPATTLKGQFVFKGRLAPNTTELTITTNRKSGTDASDSQTPKMEFKVPLQGGAN